MFEDQATINIGVEDQASDTLKKITNVVNGLEQSTALLTVGFKVLEKTIGAGSKLSKQAATYSKTLNQGIKQFETFDKTLGVLDKKLIGFGKTTKNLTETVKNYFNGTNNLNTAQKTLSESTEKIGSKFTKLVTELNVTDSKWSRLTATTWAFNQALEKLSIVMTSLQAVNILNNSFDDLQKAITKADEALLLLQTNGLDTSGFNVLQKLNDAMYGDFNAASEVALTSITRFNQFQSALAQVNTIAKKSIPELEKYGDQIQDLVSSDLKNAVSSTDALTASYQALSAGFTSATESSQVMTAALKLASATNANSYETVELLSKTLQAYSLSASDAADVAGKLNAIVEKGLTTVPELSLNFGQTASVAAKANIKLEELSGALAVLTTQGTSTQVALSGLQSLFRGIISGEYTEGLAQYGITFDAMTVKSKGLVNALEEINTKLGGNQEKLQSVIQESQAFTTVLGLTGAKAKNLKETIDYVTKSGAEQLEKLFNTRIDNDALLKFQQILNKVSEIVIRIGKSLNKAGVFDKGLEYLEKWASKSEWFIDNFGQFVPAIINVNLGLKTLNQTVGIFAGTIIKITGLWLTFRYLIKGGFLQDIPALGKAILQNNLILNDQISVITKLKLVLGQLFGFQSLQKYNAQNEVLSKQNEITKQNNKLQVLNNKLQREGLNEKQKTAILNKINNEQKKLQTLIINANTVAQTTNNTVIAQDNKLKTLQTTLLQRQITQRLIETGAIKKQTVATSILLGTQKLLNKELGSGGKVIDALIQAPTRAINFTGKVAGVAGNALLGLKDILTGLSPALLGFGGALIVGGKAFADFLLYGNKAQTGLQEIYDSFAQLNSEIPKVAEETNIFKKSLKTLREESVKLFGWEFNGLKVLAEGWSNMRLQAMVPYFEELDRLTDRFAAKNLKIQSDFLKSTKQGIFSQDAGNLIDDFNFKIGDTEKSLGGLIRTLTSSKNIEDITFLEYTKGIEEFKRLSDVKMKNWREELDINKKILDNLKQKNAEEKDENVRTANQSKIDELETEINKREKVLNLIEETNKQILRDNENLKTFLDRQRNQQGKDNPYYAALENQRKTSITSLKTNLKELQRISSVEGQVAMSNLRKEQRKTMDELDKAQKIRDTKDFGNNIKAKKKNEELIDNLTLRLEKLNKEILSTDQLGQEFDGNISRTISSITDQLESGFINAEKAISLMKETFTPDILDNLDPAQLKEYQKLIQDLNLQVFEDKKKIIASELKLYENLNKNKYFYTKENEEKIIKLQKETAKIQVQQARALIKQLEDSKIYSPDKMNEALDALALAEQNYTQVVFEEEERRLNIKQTYRNRTIEILNKQQESIFFNTKNNAEKLLDLEKENLNDLIKLENDKLLALNKNTNNNIKQYEKDYNDSQKRFEDDLKNKKSQIIKESEEVKKLRDSLKKEDDSTEDGRKNIDAKKAKMREKLDKLQESKSEIKELEKTFKVRQERYIKLAEEERKTYKAAEKESIRQLELLKIEKLNIYKKELDLILKFKQDQLNLERTQDELLLWQGKQTVEQLQHLNHNYRLEELQNQESYYKTLIEKAKQNNADVTELEQKLAETQTSIYKEKYARLREITETEIAKINNEIKKIEINGSIELRNNDALINKTEIQLKLLNQKKNLIQEMDGLAVQDLTRVAENVKSEKRRRKLVKEINEIKRQSLLFEIQMNKQILAIEREKNKLALEKQKIENEINQAKSAASIAQLKAQEKLILADPTKTQEEKEAASLQILAAQKELEALQFESVLIDKQKQLEDKSNILQDFINEAKNRSALANLDLEIAGTTKNPKDDRRAINQLEQTARQNFNNKFSTLFADFLNESVSETNIEEVRRNVRKPGIISGKIPNNGQSSNNYKPEENNIKSTNNLLDSFSSKLENQTKQLTDTQLFNFQQYKELLSNKDSSLRRGSLILKDGAISDYLRDYLFGGSDIIRGDINKKGLYNHLLNDNDKKSTEAPNIGFKGIKTRDNQSMSHSPKVEKINIEAPITINIENKDKKEQASDLGKQMQNYMQGLVDEINRRI